MVRIRVWQLLDREIDRGALVGMGRLSLLDDA